MKKLKWKDKERKRLFETEKVKTRQTYMQADKESGKQTKKVKTRQTYMQAEKLNSQCDYQLHTNKKHNTT